MISPGGAKCAFQALPGCERLLRRAELGSASEVFVSRENARSIALERGIATWVLPDGETLVRLAETEESDSRVIREADWLARLNGEQDHVASLLAVGQLRGRWFEVLHAGGPLRVLDEVLLEAPPDRIQRTLESVGRALGDWRRRRLVHGTLAAWKILVSEGDRAILCGLDSMRHARALELRGSVDDLGTLLATLPICYGNLWTRTILSDASACHSTLSRRMVRVAEIASRNRGTVPRLVPTTSRRETSLDVAAHSLLDRWMPSHPGAKFEDVFPGMTTRHLRERDRRVNQHVTLDLPGGEVELYLKRHELPPSGRGAGADEWARHVVLRGAGIETPLPAAKGRIGECDFFMSFKVPEGRALDRLLERDGILSSQVRRRLGRELGSLVGRFHSLQFCHRDLYLCHLLWSPRGLTLIDLQRVEEYVRLPSRRRIKDLACLYYSSLATSVRPVDRMRFLAAYLPGATRSHRRALIRRVLRKAAQIARHAGPPSIGGPRV